MNSSKSNEQKYIGKLEELITNAVLKGILKDKKIGVLFSGGVDSVLIAKILKDNNINFTCYVTGMKGKESPDVESAKKAAKEIGFTLKIAEISFDGIESYIKKTGKIIGDFSLVKLGVGITFYRALEEAKKDSIKIIYTGLGAEEIFAGYKRHVNARDINKECKRGLEAIKERDLDRDEAIAKHFNMQLELPFLEKQLVDYALKIPGELKVKKRNKKEYKKYILRQTAEKMGVPEEFAWRKKIAAQYGSKVDWAIERTAKAKGFKYKSDYIRRLFGKKIGALISTGKDSWYAAYRMHRAGGIISCLITIKSKDPHSYMFHTPTIELAELQAEAADIPLIEMETKGKKEEELKDLEKAIKKAKEKYKIDGICSGALASKYQKTRIDNICKKKQINLKSYAPLWKMDQEQEMKDILTDKFEIIFTTIAAEGLDKSWLGKKINKKDIEELVKLNKKFGINIAGEGGEFESFVLDCPLFKKKIKIKESEIKDNRLIIQKAVLIPKDK